MKILMTALLVFGSMTTFATEIATHRFTEFTEAGQQAFRLYNVSLHQEGYLAVSYTEYKTRPGSIGGEQEIGSDSYKVELQEMVFKNILESVKRLSLAKIETTIHPVTCAMWPSPVLSNDHLSIKGEYDYNLNAFIGEMKLINGPQGCWVHSSVSPAAAYHATEASELTGILEVLAMNE